MKTAESIQEIREQVYHLKSEGKKVAFVPTMGALHDGHLSLIRMARKHAEAIVVSIYVNPEQFAPHEDFGTYPRTIEADLKLCKEENVDVVFMPDTETMYGSGKKYFSIDIEELNVHLDGGSRPGYFQGIALVVNKLFNIVNPNIAVFGQKDYQQFRIIEQMVKEFNHPVELLMAPIGRAEDGLALSSRNAYLSSEERTLAPSLYRALTYVAQQIENGVMEPTLLISHQQDELEAKGFENDYLSVYSLDTLQPVDKLSTGNKYVLAIAAYLGKTRLIDNLILEI
ncbi:MAG: pantoate--beta-alanine ligase [Balneola sp.]|nr:pantoate--beta-alanine ligase [Balneola sp.]MBO6651419.1 pantoate--beta-alanine ligase [Balneola sp.]MBO6712544.1 pantoate--beta-alanine ligase [Balneola sp.]MBO6800963.1 pantoate--beta-alanine ligase [Balneola sp.]MBO6870635.1 pantoate--beta-alanine ligase [Balneola sp.]